MTVQEVGRGEANDIAQTLQRLNGKTFFALLLWKLPERTSMRRRRTGMPGSTCSALAPPTG
jgi:hypothetical protein